MTAEITLDTSWLAGRYNPFGQLEAEINTLLPYIGIGTFFAQGEDAEQVIYQIHEIWLSGDLTQEEALERWTSSHFSVNELKD